MPLDVVVMRLKSHGHRFEVPCHRSKIMEYMERGRDAPLPTTDGVSVHPQIMSNAYKRETATNASLIEAFGIVEFEPIALHVIQYGELVEDSQQRVQKRRGKGHLIEDILGLIPKLLTNKFSGVAPDADEVREVFREVTKGVPFVEGADAWPQAAWVAAKIAERLDCVRSCSRVEAVIDADLEPVWNEWFLDFDGIVVPRLREEIKPKEHQTGEPTEPSATALAVLNKRSLRLVFNVDSAFVAAEPPSLQERRREAESFTVVPAPPRDIELFTQYAFELPPPPRSTIAIDAEKRLASALADRARPEPSAAVAPAKAVPPPLEGRSSQKKSRRRGGGDDDDDEAAAATAAASQYEKLTLKQLQELCKKHSLSTGGKKVDLIERLEVFDSTTKPATGDKRR